MEKSDLSNIPDFNDYSPMSPYSYKPNAEFVPDETSSFPSMIEKMNEANSDARSVAFSSKNSTSIKFNMFAKKSKDHLSSVEKKARR